MNAPVALIEEPTVDPRIDTCTNATLREGSVSLTPAIIAGMRDELPEDKKVGCYFVFDSASYVNVVGNNELIAAMDDVQTRREIVFTGLLGRLYGMDVLTNAYVRPERQVLPAKRVYVMAGDGSMGVACNIH